MIPDIDKAILSLSIKERFTTVNLILIRCWEEIKELCEIYRKIQEEAEAVGNSGTLEENIIVSRKSMVGTSSTGAGNSVPVPEMSSNDKLPSATADKRNQTRAQSVTLPVGL